MNVAKIKKVRLVNGEEVTDHDPEEVTDHDPEEFKDVLYDLVMTNDSPAFLVSDLLENGTVVVECL